MIQTSRLAGRVVVLCVAALALSVSNARAELVFFASGRTLSISTYRVEDGWLVLALRGGGEMRLEPSAVVRITPDEVPYPEPPAPVDAAAAAADQAESVPLSAALSAYDESLAAVSRYAAIIDRASTAHGVDPKLVRAVIQVESSYQARARSRRGAMGLMQLMPSTARQYSVANPYDPAANVDAGTRHLKALLVRYPLALALAAYNAGEGTVERFGGIPPFPETRSYVTRILKLLRG